MKKKFLLLFLIPLLIISGSFFSSKKQPQKQPEILVTIAPYKYFIEKLTDSSVPVHNLVPEEADPHGFEPSAKELVRLFSAKAWFLVGEPFENQFLPIIQRNDPQLQVFHLNQVVSNKLNLKCSHHNHQVEDMHFWMSPQVMRLQVQEIAKVLKELYPDKSELIETRLQDINLEFEEYDLLLKEQAQKTKSHYLLVSHPAFGYFCRDYGFRQLALENETQDPSPKELTQLYDLIKEKNIQKIYVQKQHNYKLAKMTADHMNLSMVEVNPYKENYFENLRFFSQELAKD